MRFQRPTPKLPLAGCHKGSRGLASAPTTIELSTTWALINCTSRGVLGVVLCLRTFRGRSVYLLKPFQKTNISSSLVPLPGGSAHGREELRDRPPHHRDEEPLGRKSNAVAGQPRLRQDPVLVAQLLLYGELATSFGWRKGDWGTNSGFRSSPLRVWTTSGSGSISPPRSFRRHTSSSSGRTPPHVA